MVNAMNLLLQNAFISLRSSHKFSKKYLLKISLLLCIYLFSSQSFSIGLGTGFYISPDGYLITNYHVIAGAKSIGIYNQMDQISEARVVRTDINNDLALLKVEGEKFTFLPIARSSNVQKGEKVFTIGFPNTNLQGMEAKVTEGIISSLSGIQGQPSEFQISVPVQPGNSGGPLIDEKGNVIGIVVAKLAASAALRASGTLPENVNYAIKSNYLLELVATVPALKAPSASAQRKPALTELIAKAEPAVVLVAALPNKPIAAVSPTQKEVPSAVDYQKPVPQPIPSPLQQDPPKVRAHSVEPEGPTKYLCAETFPEYGQKNFGEAYKKISSKAQKKDSVAQLCLGRMYDFGYEVKQSYAEAIKWYRLSAEQGNAFGQNSLGFMYDKGRGVTQSDTEAVKWYRLAAEQNEAMGQNNLGWMYANGRGVTQSDTEAVKWYQLAAEQGNVLGQTHLGLMYANGRGVMQSDKEAAKWFKLAAEQGNALAQSNLGWMYDKGRGVIQSDTEAVKWFKLAAEQGNALGQTNLGLMYANGRGVAQSDQEAVNWYLLAAEQGNASAQTSLGLMYVNGRGVTQSDKEAAKWFKLAAEQGEAMGQNNLGIMYLQGRGVEESRVEAIKWFKLAANNKSNPEAAIQAQDNLRKIGDY